LVDGYLPSTMAGASVIINGTGEAASGYATAAAANPGDVLELYATGLGATTTPIPPGLVFSGAYPTETLLTPWLGIQYS
jgi:uncharacterized protein (TIGR03437 family)